MGLVLQAVRGEAVERTPVWLMRQAGRYMPEYRAVRQNYTFLEMCMQPEVVTAVTMQPIEFLDVDAAILFSDILTPLIPLGFDLEFCEGRGPIIHNPVRAAADVAALKDGEAHRDLGYVYESLAMIRRVLPQEKDLIGFAGAPFTVASYAIEGGSSKNYIKIKSFMYEQEAAWKALMDRISRHTVEYLVEQLRAGAAMVQLFDSWGGVLSREDYLRYAHPWSAAIIRAVKERTGAPVIHFVKGANAWFDSLADSQADCLGCDWTLPLDRARELCGNRKSLQGNLDPVTLFAAPEVIEEHIRVILAQAKGSRGHVFNLGHGILPDTPPGHVRFAVDCVRRLSSGH